VPLFLIGKQMKSLEPAIKTSVVACIIDPRQRVLLTLRNIEPFYGQWVMPGGKIDPGEAHLAALHREVREEVGLEVQVDTLLDVYEHLDIGQHKDHYIILYYRCSPLSLEIQLNHHECSEAAWFSVEELSQLVLPPGCRQVLTQIYPDLPWKEDTPPGKNL